MSATVLPFDPRRRGYALCDAMANATPCSDPKRLSGILKASGFASDPRDYAHIRKLIAIADEEFRDSRFVQSLCLRYALLRAVGTEGENREEIIQESKMFALRMVGTGTLTGESLRDMIESKRERLRCQLDDVEKLL